MEIFVAFEWSFENDFKYGRYEIVYVGISLDVARESLKDIFDGQIQTWVDGKMVLEWITQYGANHYRTQ